MAHSPPQYSHKPYRDSDIDTIASAPALNASASPEDERFDHASIQEASSRSVNLVRGASARSKGAASHYTDGRPLSYIDENFNHYSKDKSQGQDESAVPLVHNAADIGGYSGGKPGERNYEDLGTIAYCMLHVSEAHVIQQNMQIHIFLATVLISSPKRLGRLLGY